MRAKTPAVEQIAAHALQRELRDADDVKILRITAMLDQVADATMSQPILDPLRARLGVLKPARPQRFSRLLLTPLDPLIVPAPKWRPGQALIPRTILGPIAHVVRAGLGEDAAVIDDMIHGHKDDATQIVTTIGAGLWPRAADILAISGAPGNWAATGIPEMHYPALSRAIAAVLRRAPALRSLWRDEEVAVLQSGYQKVSDILQNVVAESAEGCAMVMQLILSQAPCAAIFVRQFISSSQNTTDRTALTQAFALGTEQTLKEIESEAGSIGEISRAPLIGASEEIRRVAALLRELENATPGLKGRLKIARDRLDEACRTRFSDGLNLGLVQPLAGACEPIDAAGQTELELCARNLRALESEARKVGGAGNYDRLLHQASETVQAAADEGTLTPVRKLRLIEILAGSEAATAIYQRKT